MPRQTEVSPRGLRKARRRFLYLVLLACLLLQTGCWDRREPENVAWVTAIGVDTGEKQPFLFTFQIAVARQFAGGQGGGAGGGGRGETPSQMVFSVEAPSIVVALTASQTFVARHVSLLHTKAVIIGEEIARENLMAFLGAATRFVEFRRSTQVFVARGKARDFLQLLRPKLENNPAWWFELMVAGVEEIGYAPSVRIHELVMDIERDRAPFAPVVAPRLDLAAGEGEIGTEGDRAPASPVPDVVAGDVPRLGELPVDVAGTAVFYQDRLTGYLTARETLVLMMMTRRVRQVAWDIPDPTDPELRLVVTLSTRTPSTLEARMRGGRVRVQVSVKLEAQLASIQSTTDYTVEPELSRLEEAMEKGIKREAEAMLRKTLHEWEADVLRVGRELRKAFATIGDWHRFGWNKRVRRAEVDVAVDVRIRRTGLQRTPAVPKR